MEYMVAENVSNEVIGDLVIDVPVVRINALGKTINDLFEKNSELEGIVVVDNDTPVGIIMRSYFYNKIGKQYGFALIMNRPVTILMDSMPLIVDYSADVSKVGVKAMNRPQSSLYDFIIIVKDGKYVGAVSIRLFLVELSKKREAELGMLKIQHEDLQKANLQEIELRSTLEIKSSSVKNLLDNAGQGFLSFGNDFIIEDENSIECSNIFNGQVTGLNFVEVLSHYFPAEKSEQLSMILLSYFQNEVAIKDDAYLWLLPRECVVNHKTIRLEYKKINFLSQKKIMIILTDISDKVAMERWMEEERQNQRLLIKALKNHGELNRMIDEIADFFKHGISSILETKPITQLALNEIFRIVHTYKGDFAQFGMHNSAKKLHAIEDELSIMLDNIENVTITSLVEWQSKVDVQNITVEDILIITNILGDSYFDSSDKITVSRDDIEAIEMIISKQFDEATQAVILPAIRRLKYKNLKEIMSEYSDYIQYMSERLSKSNPVFNVSGEDILVDPLYYYDVFKTMVHLFRNMVDHGIESPDDRLENGKNECGQIDCIITSEGESGIQIILCDDGQGIDFNKLKQKAIEKGLFNSEELETMKDEELVQVICMPNFSTKDEASTISGRGMGMSAVMESVKAIKGTIKIDTATGKGTKYILTIPNK